METSSPSKTPILTLLLLLLSILTLASPTPAPAPSAAGDISELLTSHGLPPGLFPNAISGLKAENDGRITLTLNEDCFVLLKSKAVLHYQKMVTGVIKYGKIVDVMGVTLQLPSGWDNVSEMKYDTIRNQMEMYRGLLRPVVLPMDDFTDAPSCLDLSSLLVAMM